MINEKIMGRVLDKGREIREKRANIHQLQWRLTLRPVTVKRDAAPRRAALRCLYFSISQAWYCFNVMRKKRRSSPPFKHLRAVYTKECRSTPVPFVIATTSLCDELHRFVVVPKCHFHQCDDKSK